MRKALVVGLGLLGGCVQYDRPPWVVDHPVAWGLIARVVEPGGYSSDLLVPEGRERAEALPLDTLELQWIGVGPPDIPVPPPIWLVCPFGCGFPFDDEELPACPVPLPLSFPETCRLGEGERVRLSLGGAYTVSPEFRGRLEVMAVTGHGDVDPETCLQRYTIVPRAGLEACLMQQRALTLGPEWKAFTTVPALMSLYSFDGELPPDLAAEPPDLNPVLTGLQVLRSGRSGFHDLLVQGGDTITVHAGDRIAVRPQYSDDSQQEYYAFTGASDRLTVMPREEQLVTRIGLSAEVHEIGDPLDDEIHQWIVPDDPEPVDLYLYVADTRQGRAFATLRFVAEDAAPAP
ncbi:hypothetical protein [Nannocystis sp. SCPEA4]|uniref:hypothetical protein n=1 Tax=Nannocystis sp. SCPEA4 TaxID=2996787 RepID=UPI002271858D|nr:hypothetical protein [Nannocystis sp. SCPEA4]MCY1053871.1 hypothetical protein [Nannocystis sp. SCPEA4]